MILARHEPEAGLFSHLNFLITHLEIHRGERIHVDWTSGLPYSQPERGNLFEFLFEQLSEKLRDDVVVEAWPHHRYTGPHAWELYLGDGSWRHALNRCWRMVSVRASILDEVQAIRSSWPSEVAGVHVRNRNIGKECPGGRSPALSDFSRFLKGTFPVFLATDNREAVEYFQNHLGERLLVRDIPRAEDMSTEFHLSEPRTFEDARNCLVDALLLSGCKTFFHSISNIATAVLYMNPDLPHRLVTAGLEWDSTPTAIDDCKSNIRLIHVEHPFWQDWIILAADGTYRRHSVPTEGGHWEDLKESRILLDWESWTAETIELKGECYRFGSLKNGMNGINSLCYRIVPEQA